ncbi:chromosome partitioning protein ParB [Xenorhabdus vietnamensis]|uniref:Chromosome partitioning protein ParB n=1 Tax=Xenorhabdus vietnamensis TaxID=351656 RepID=A0A1Y2SAB9_9GAMM|nr:ParB family protein [Xenorhabdus vietnamensis]OTA14441.1 chromosome partitioning protein ParB [Xenorhabdus vietnamensis]
MKVSDKSDEITAIPNLLVLLDEERTSDTVKDTVMDMSKSVKLSYKPQPVEKTEVVTPLSVFIDKRIYARHKENTKNRILIYEFARLDKR